MSNRIYALLVGINAYTPPVRPLRGCLNDLAGLGDWLAGFAGPRLALETLQDAEATRANVIDGFRRHLAQAGPGDSVLFHYSGHGARERAAPEFSHLYPDGWGEGLVCVDSRSPGGHDLADKELAVLIDELAARGPRVTVVLDSCHSGAATRNADAFALAGARFTAAGGPGRPRSLESYLDGHYTRLAATGARLVPPTGRHILLAACDRLQQAQESRDHRGVFTTTLLEVLTGTRGAVSYADLFLHTRTAVCRHADNQTPQFETHGGFDAFAGFLGAVAGEAGRSRYRVWFDRGAWQVNCGALHGLPTDPDRPVELALYREAAPGAPVARAVTTSVGAQQSDVRLLDLEAGQDERFQAQVTSLPVPPLPVRLSGDAAGIDAVQAALAGSADRAAYGFTLGTDPAAPVDYELNVQDARVRLTERRTGRMLQGADGLAPALLERLFVALRGIAAWERAVALRNPATRMDPGLVDFQFVEELPGGQTHIYGGDAITLDIGRDGAGWRAVNARLQASNRSGQPLHFALVYLSNAFGVQVPYNERIEPGEALFDLIIGAEARFRLTLEPDEGDEATHYLQLLVSTERVDDFLLTQVPLAIGMVHQPQRGDMQAKGLEFGAPRKTLAHRNEWFTKTIRVRLVRQADRVGAAAIALADGRVEIAAHPAFRAGVSLGTLPVGSRDAGTGTDFDFYRALARQGIQPLPLTVTRGEAAGVLDLTDIEHAEALAGTPLELTLDLGLAPDEGLLPLAFDGEDLLLAGTPERDAAGRVHLYIDRIPDHIPSERRSLGKALRLYFFKTYLRRDVDQLCWVDYGADGRCERRPEGVAARVMDADNILLVVHGIIGDTANMLACLPRVRGADGLGLHERFDLVLSFDYENLGGSIQDKARTLKRELNEGGLHADDGKRLTLLVHSMGGLVTRWLIEREQGGAIIDHLVMCGTPQLGSPLGYVDQARDVVSVLTTWTVNANPALAPFGTALLFLLRRSENISPTLEEMAPNTQFISTLNDSGDPRRRYTLLAGDVSDYDAGDDPLLGRIVAKLGKGPVFDLMYQGAGHDLAVSTASGLGVPDPRDPAPGRRQIACHHMNYFESEAGLAALAAVDWTV